MFCTVSNELVFELRHPGFVSPRGVFITPEGMLYVADAGAGAVFIFDGRYEPVRTHTRPDAMAFGETAFAPNRVAVDLRGNMYIVGEGVFGGIIQLSAEGEFLGFFASNRTRITLLERIQEFFFTDRQMEARAARLPNTFSSVAADARGVIYSVSMGGFDMLQGGTLQRHDMAGRNTLRFTNIWTTPDLIDIAVDARGNIFVARANGYILVITNNGDYIHGFGAAHLTGRDIVGQFASLQSVAVSSRGYVWALDSERNFLQSFEPTEYARMIYAALDLFNSGLYPESAEVWEQVLRHNQMSVLAHTGMGRAQLYQQDFEGARASFFLAGNRQYYSTAFWEVRNTWLLTYLAPILVAVAAYFIAMFAVRQLDRKRVIARKTAAIKYGVMNAPYIRHVFFAFSVARHPLNAYYDLKRGDRGSLGGAAFHFLLFFAAYMAYTVSRGFLMQTTEVVDMDFMVIVGGFLGLYVLFVICNYLVTSIQDGEGNIIDIFKLVSYGVFPFTITLFAVTALSHVVTYNEVFLLDLTLMAGVAYTVSVLWVGFQEIHDYSFGATLKSLIITAAFMMIAIVVLFNLLILFDEVVAFFESIGREVYANVTGMY
jgi:sugar lactone lactonase YvrE